MPEIPRAAARYPDRGEGHLRQGGVPTEGGSKLCLGRTPFADARTVQLLKEAGAIVLGKLTTWEFAIGGTAFDTPFRPARNPWNTAHDPAGSSSGSGAAIAAGLSFLA